MAATGRPGLVAAAFLGLAALAWPHGTHALECGEVVSGLEVLDRDLLCATEPAITVGSGAELDLGGFTVTCQGSEVGILLDGAAAWLDNGAVVGCSTAVQVAGSGAHTVRRITASGANQGLWIAPGSDGNHILRNAVLRGQEDAAIQVDGAHNTLRFNAVGGSLDQAFEINGDDNLIEGNHVTGVAEGVQLTGTRNRVVGNHIVGTTDRGIEVRAGGHLIQRNLIADGAADGIALLDTGDGNEVVGNTIIGHADQGLFVGTFGNTLTGNLVLLNGTDLTDVTENCDGNRWADNEFTTSLSDDCVD